MAAPSGVTNHSPAAMGHSGNDSHTSLCGSQNQTHIRSWPGQLHVSLGTAGLPISSRLFFGHKPISWTNTHLYLQLNVNNSLETSYSAFKEQISYRWGWILDGNRAQSLSVGLWMRSWEFLLLCLRVCSCTPQIPMPTPKRASVQTGVGSDGTRSCSTSRRGLTAFLQSSLSSTKGFWGTHLSFRIKFQSGRE